MEHLPGLGERQSFVQTRPGQLQPLDQANWLPDQWPPGRDYANAAASHPIKNIQLAQDVPSVKTGTPVIPGLTGWRIAAPTEKPMAYAGGPHGAGETFNAYRAMTLETYQSRFQVGDKYSITEIDDAGNIRLTRDPGGHITALSRTQVLLDVSSWVPPSSQLVMPILEPVSVEPPPKPEMSGPHKEIPEDDYVRED